MDASGPGTLGIAGAAAGVFVLADLIYTVDHYFVHHDRERYRQTHGRHHRRYNGVKDGVHLDAYERSTYNSAGLGFCVCMSVVTLFSGNPGFLLGAALKWAHGLLFHLYQHRWWGSVPVGRLEYGRPRRTWGLATARYHSFHHAKPNDARFTYAESWAGFDRVLERLDPWLLRFTADARRARRTASSAPVHDEAAP